MTLSILVPFRDPDGIRTPAKEWIVARWHHFWPDAEIIVAPDDGRDPFSKSVALNNCAAQATGDVLVLLDADTWVDATTMARAIALAEKGAWVLPGAHAHRMTKRYTTALLKQDPSEPIIPILNRQLDVEVTSTPVGFIHVLPRAAWDRVNGMDPRFRGWGGEDSCFIQAVDTLWDRHLRLDGHLISLWHPRPRVAGRRVWPGQAGRNSGLMRRYSLARGKPNAMAALVSEW